MFGGFNPLSKKRKTNSQLQDPLIERWDEPGAACYDGGGPAPTGGFRSTLAQSFNPQDMSSISENSVLTTQMVDQVYEEFHCQTLCPVTKQQMQRLNDVYVSTLERCSKCYKTRPDVDATIKQLENPELEAKLKKIKLFQSEACLFCPMCTQEIIDAQESQRNFKREAISEILVDIAQTQRLVSAREHMDDHLITEPKTFMKKIRSVSQNMYEIEATIFVIGLAYLHDSILACCFILSLNLLLYTATMDRFVRIKYGRWCLYLLIAICSGVMLLKGGICHFVNNNPNEERLSGLLNNCLDLINKDNQWVAAGFNHDVIGAWIPLEGQGDFPSQLEYAKSQALEIYNRTDNATVQKVIDEELERDDGAVFYFNQNPCKALRGKDDESLKSAVFPGPEGGKVRKTLHYWDSINFEFGFFIVMIYSLVRLESVEFRLNNLRRNYAKVVMVKNYEAQLLSGSLDSDDEEQRVVTQANKEEIKRKKEEKQKYKAMMNKLHKDLSVVYLDCHHFMGLNKVSFLWLLVAQLMQTLGCPGLFDIPQMVMILLVLSIYAFRKTVPVPFGFLTMIVAYWIQIALMFKLCLGVCLETELVVFYLNHHTNGRLSQILRPLFGNYNFDDDDKTMKATYYVSLVACIYLSQLWKQAKWADIRDFIKDSDSKRPEEADKVIDRSRVQQCMYYFTMKGEKKGELSVLDTLREENKAWLKSQKSSSNTEILKRGEDLIGKARDELNVFLPTVVLWLIRILMGFQCYLYHTKLNMFHLGYVLSTFVFTGRFASFVGSTLMLPIYLGEFIITFGLEIDKVKDLAVIKEYGESFNEITWRKDCLPGDDSCSKLNFKYPIFEQLLQFIILSLLCISISCYKISIDTDQNQRFIEIFNDKIHDKNSNILWNVLLFVLRRIQSLVLLALFVQGRNNLNSLRNLGFMIFFVVYTASESLYRHTQKALVIFLSGFILGQYYYSLVYRRYLEDPVQEKKFRWLSFYTEDAKPTWDENSVVYFRHTPYPFDWIVLLVMNALSFVNIFFKKNDVETLETQAFENLRNRYPKTMFTVLRMTNYCSQWCIILVIITMFYYICHAEPNIVNWVFFIANIINFSFVAKGDNKSSTNRHSKNCSDFITFYSAFMLLSNIMFILFIGENPKPDQEDSLDRAFINNFPKTYDNLDIIGFRWHVPLNETRQFCKNYEINSDCRDSLKNGTALLLGSPCNTQDNECYNIEEELNEDRTNAFMAKFFSYIVYLMVSLYLSSYFHSKMKTSKQYEDLTEENYTRLFMYKQRAEYDELRAQKNKKELDKSMNRSVREDQMEKKKIQKRTFWDKEIYSELDIIQAYENIRYEPYFISYQWIEWWPLFDTLAAYGHLFNNVLIVYISIVWSVNFFMAFNVICVCCYYSIATYRLSKRAFECYTDSGLQSQTDIKCAKMITKRYKKGAFFEFLDIRHKLWKVQFFMLIVCSSVAFGSTLLQLIKEKCMVFDEGEQKFVVSQDGSQFISDCPSLTANIDTTLFYLFMGGMFKPIDQDQRGRFYKPIFCLTIGFLLERNCINWLTNRHGLTYNKLQKVLELELRKQAIEENWPKQPPRYNPQIYQDNYFGQDFDELLSRFSETEKEGNKRRKLMRDTDKEVREFVPHNVAKRIQSFISFSVKLSGQCPDLQLDDLSINLLNEIDASFDEHEKQQREQNKDPEFVTMAGNTSKDVLGVYQSLRLSSKENAFIRKDKLDQYGRATEVTEYNEQPIWQRVNPGKLRGQFVVPDKKDRRYAVYKNHLEGWVLLNHDNLILLLDDEDEWKKVQEISKSECKLTYEWDRIDDNNPIKIQYTKGELFQYAKFERSGCYVQIHHKRFQSKIDHETIPVLRQNKIKFYEQVLKEAVDFKYKVSFYKGVQFVFETLILLILMVSLILKSNFISIIYLLFIIKYLVSRSKTRLIILMAQFISFAFSAQYIMYVMNLTHHTSPMPYPKQYKDYPAPASQGIKHWFPFFFRYQVFHDLRMTYLVGIGFEKSHIFNILLDFFNLYIVSMYILHYRNPILVKSMQKLFWRFPSKYEDEEKWDRIDPLVRKQVNWLYDPIEHTSPHYNRGYSKAIGLNFKDPKEVKRAELQYKFAKDYNKNQELDLDQILIDYIDLKYDAIWSNKYCNHIKKTFKQQSVYYRLVKQGSILIYLCLHIFTVFLILLMAACRQSFIALGYVFIILPYIKECAQVLIQKSMDDDSKIDELEKMKQAAKEELDDLKQNSSGDTEANEEIEKAQDTLDMINSELKALKIERTKKQSKMSAEEKMQRRKFKAGNQWKVIHVIKFYLMIYAMTDFTIQVIFQMPIQRIIAAKTFMGLGLEQVGIRKVWIKEEFNGDESEPFSYETYINQIEGFQGQRLSKHNLGLELFMCILICILSLQTEIFESYGYQKFVTKKDGMDKLIKFSKIKAYSIAYTINNRKLQKVFSIQRRREVIEETVEILKMKINNWRRATQAVLTGRASFANWAPKQDQQSYEPPSLEIEKQQTSLTDNEETKKKKSVAMHQDVIEAEEKKEQVAKEQKPQKKKLSERETKEIIQTLTKAFVLEKISKLNTRSQIYLWLNQKYVQLIMFKNDEENLYKIHEDHLKGQVSTPTELEQIMEEDAKFQIDKAYDHKDGAADLYQIQKQFQSKGGATSGKELLEKTGLHKKIKLKQMSRVWNFTRRANMRFHLLETFVYMIISNTQSLIYFCMIASMYTNAGLISLPYPIAVFGYALLEETRPRKEFWNWVEIYTIALLFLKFSANLSVLEDFFGSESFKYAQSWLRLGIYDYEHIADLIWYMLPEILIICLIMLNEIQLNLLDLYYQNEQDIETITDGQERILADGDMDMLKRKKVFNANMAMFTYFKPKQRQAEENKARLDEQSHQQEIEEKNQQAPAGKNKGQGEKDYQELQREMDKLDGFETMREKQTHLLKQTSEHLWMSSHQFDIDSSANAVDSVFDRLVQENIIQKTLEADDLVIVDGKTTTGFEYASTEKLDDDLMNDKILDSISGGDFEEEYNDKVDFIEKKDQPKLSKFEKSKYFARLFPTLRIQKPGFDYYAPSTAFLGVLGVYIGFYYSYISVDKTTLIESVKTSNKLFMGEMALCLVAVMSLIVVERYINRSDTKKAAQQGIELGKKKSYVDMDKMFKRSNTARSMTVTMKSMKTSDIDMSKDSSVKSFFQDMQDDKSMSGNLLAKTQVTQQQKIKFYLHWFMLIFIHIFVFWYIPITGNMTLFDSPQCPDVEEGKQLQYHCRSFHTNGYLRLFYIILLGYLMLSGLQIKHGMPIQKIASSVCQHFTQPAYFLSLGYIAIPFAMEVRCVMDFTFNKTALDVFQCWQLFQYHLDMYQAKLGNEYYVLKVLGTKTHWFDKLTLGVGFMIVYLGLLIAPVLIFSDYGYFITKNPVKGAEIGLSFIVRNEMDANDLDNYDLDINVAMNTSFDTSHVQMTTTDASKITDKSQFVLYNSKFPLLRDFDEQYFKWKGYDMLTETKEFAPYQFQEVVASEYSDEAWTISSSNKRKFAQQLADAVNPTTPSRFQMVFDYNFVRDLPTENKTTKGNQTKTLDLSEYYDCQTAIQIRNTLELVENKDNSYCQGDALNPDNSTIRFYEAFYPIVVLGPDQNASYVTFQSDGFLKEQNQKHDLLLKYQCSKDNPGEWFIYSSSRASSIPQQFFSKNKDSQPPIRMKENTTTCEFADEESEKLFNELNNKIDEAIERQVNETYKQEIHFGEDFFSPENDANSKDQTFGFENHRFVKDNHWKRLTFTVLSMIVSSSFFSGYSVKAFYTGFVVLIAPQIKINLLMYTYMAWQYETTHSDALIKLIEAVYIHRHEEDLIGEEECYRMLVEVVRSPELYKLLTGCTTKGACDPLLDKLSKKDIEKLKHLDRLERLDKGFDVEKLRNKITQKATMTKEERTQAETTKKRQDTAKTFKTFRD